MSTMFNLIIDNLKEKFLVKIGSGTRNDIIVESKYIKNSIIKIFRSVRIFGNITVDNIIIKNKEIFDTASNLFIDKISTINSEYADILVRSSGSWESKKLKKNIFIDLQEADINNDIDVKFIIPSDVYKNIFYVTFYYTVKESTPVIDNTIFSIRYNIESYNTGESYLLDENNKLHNNNYSFKYSVYKNIKTDDKNKIIFSDKQLVGIISSTDLIKGTLGIIRVRTKILNDELARMFINKGNIIGVNLEYFSDLNSS